MAHTYDVLVFLPVTKHNPKFRLSFRSAHPARVGEMNVLMQEMANEHVTRCALLPAFDVEHTNHVCLRFDAPVNEDTEKRVLELGLEIAREADTGLVIHGL